MLLKIKKNFQFFAKLCFSLLNLIIFIINFHFLFESKNFESKDIKDEEKLEIQNIKINYQFKSADNFLNLVFKKYQQISNYLNSKYDDN